MRRFGRFLKLAGLVIAPAALFLQLGGVLKYGWQELAMLGVAVCIFSIGHICETRAR